MASLPDPDICTLCKEHGEVIESKPKSGYRIRRRQCSNGHRWTTYETVLKPLRLLRALESLDEDIHEAAIIEPDAWRKPCA